MSAEGTKMPEPIRAFAEHAKAEGHDTAYTYDTERSRWVFLNPMTADLWRFWQEATRLAMERAEKVCERQAERWTTIDAMKVYAARECQFAIRALADVDAKEKGE